jgi:hypothetical protein
MASNAEIIRKADFELNDLTNKGLLNPEQAAKFIRKLIKEPTLLRDSRTVEMSAPQRNINKIQFASAIMKPGNTTGGTPGDGTPGAALAAGDRSAPTTEQIQLNTSEVMAEVRIPYDVIEDNIERGNIGTHQEGGNPAAGGGFVDTILTLMAERAALDLEDMALNGDTGLASGLLSLQDGYMKLVEDGGNIADAEGASISKEIFKDGVKTLPDQYLRQRDAMRHYVSHDNETEYRDTVANRATAVGDGALQGLPEVFAFGVPVRAVSLMPATKGLFTNPLNLLWGIQRAMHLEWDKEITSRTLIIVLSARVAVQVEETEAAVAYNNIG